jgi:sugar phosphate isomerase/epimerase
MRLGLSSYAYGWAVGVRGFLPPEAPLSCFALLDRAAALGVRVVQIADNLPLDELPSAQLDRLVSQAAEQKITLEYGVRGILALPAQLALASRLKARVLRTVIDSEGHHPGPDEIVARLRAIAPECERRGITLAIENHDRFRAVVLEDIFARRGFGRTSGSVSTRLIRSAAWKVPTISSLCSARAS